MFGDSLTACAIWWALSFGLHSSFTPECAIFSLLFFDPRLLLRRLSICGEVQHWDFGSRHLNGAAPHQKSQAQRSDKALHLREPVFRDRIREHRK
jgi:hypothetical protein